MDMTYNTNSLLNANHYNSFKMNIYVVMIN